MGGRGANSGNSNLKTLSKIVNLENKRNGDDIRQYLKENNLRLVQDYENVQKTVKQEYKTLAGKTETTNQIINERKATTVGVYRKNTRIGTIQEILGKWRIKR